MDEREFLYAAKRLANDDTFNMAADRVQSAVLKDLLTAATPADRESKFQEYDALRRVRELLKKLALQAENLDAQK